MNSHAKQIADAATALDWLKNGGTPEQRAEAAKHIRNLHDIAEQMRPELYLAGEDGLAGPGWASVTNGAQP